MNLGLNRSLYFLFLLASTATVYGDWKHTLYGSVPEDCTKLKVNEEQIFRCKVEKDFNQQVLSQFNQLDHFFVDEVEQALDSKYEAALLRKLADPKAATILEAFSQYALLEAKTPAELEKTYQTLPHSCINSFPQAKALKEKHQAIIKKLDSNQMNSHRYLKQQSVLEDLSYLAQLQRSKKDLNLKRMHAQQNADEVKKIDKARVAVDQLIEQIKQKEPLLQTSAFKNFEANEQFKKTLEEPNEASQSQSLANEIKTRMNSAAKELRQKLGSNNETGLGNLCKNMQGDLTDLVHHRFARGIKEAEFVDALLNQEEELEKLTNHKLNPSQLTSEKISYFSLMGAASCRLKLKVINNSSVDLARDFAINAGLTIGTAGLSSIATGVSVGSKVYIAANTGRTGRMALASISALDLGTAALIDLPQVYDNCIKGNVNQDHYFINSDISPLTCGMSIGMAGVSHSMAALGVKNTIKAFKNAGNDKALAQAMRINLHAQTNPKLADALSSIDKQIGMMSQNDLLARASTISGKTVSDPAAAKELLRSQLLIASLPATERGPMLKLSLQSTGSIPPRGKVPARLTDELQDINKLDIATKKEVIAESIEGTSLSPRVSDDLAQQGFLGTVPTRDQLLTRMKQQVDPNFRFSDLIDDQKSESFLRTFQAGSNAKEKALFFNVENTAQKLLNDQYIVDKELVDSLNDHYKKIFYQEIKNNPHLSKALMGEFNDFKSIKLAFDKSKVPTNTLNSELNRVFKKANNDFASYCNQLNVKGLLTKDGVPVKGMVGDPRHWFIAGTGDSVDMSSIFARLSKNHYQADKSSQIITGKHFAKELKDLAHKTENLRQEAAAILKAHPQAMNDGILDEELVAILRKAGSKGQGEEYLKTVHKKVAAAYNGLDLSDAQILTLRSYYQSADTFSPPVLSATRVTHNLDSATGDIVSFDYRGIGALNGQANMRALKEWDGDSMDSLAKLIRHHDDSVTNRLMELRQKATTQSIEQAFSEVSDMAPNWSKGNITYSGDDGILKVPAEIKSSYLKKFGQDGEAKYQQAVESIYSNSIDNLKNIGERADRVRITRLNAQDAKTFAHMPLGEQISKQEGIEKGIREFIQGRTAPDEDFLLTVESSFDPRGSLVYKINAHKAKEQEKINQLIEEYISQNQLPVLP